MSTRGVRTKVKPNGNGSQPAELQSKWAEQGTKGLTNFAGFVQAAYESSLYWPTCFALYNRIRRSDPEISIVRTAYSALARKVEIDVVLPEPQSVGGEQEDGEPSDDDKAAQEFYESELENVDGGVTRWMDECASYTPFLGWGWWEAVPGLRKKDWRPPDDDPWRSEADDGLVGMRRLAFRDHSSFFRWDMDDKTGRVHGLEQCDPPNNNVIIPLENSLHVTFGDSNNPEGLSPLEAVWRLERIKYGLEIVQGMGFEHAAGYLDVKAEKAKLDSGDFANIQKAARAIMTAQEGNYAAWPAGFTGELKDVTFSAAPALLEAIRFYHLLKLQVYQFAWAAIASTAGAGAYSAMKDASSMFLLSWNSMWTSFIDQYDEQVGKRLWKWNADKFPGAMGRPKYKAKPLSKIIDLIELGQFVTAVKAAMPLGDDDFIEIRKRSGFLPEELPEAVAPVANFPAPQPETTAGAETQAEGDMTEEPGTTDDEGKIPASDEPELAMLAAKSPDVTKDGVMIGFLLPVDKAQKMAITKENAPIATSILKPDDMHITLTYLGKIADQALEMRDLMIIARKFANNHGPISGIYRKAERFHNPESNYGDAIYAAFESDQIKDFRDDLASMLKDAGFTLSSKPFVPHTTLAYIPSGGKTPEIEIPETGVTFEDILVFWGADMRTISLKKEPQPESEMAMLARAIERAASVMEMEYSPDQPRDESGKWASGGSSGGSTGEGSNGGDGGRNPLVKDYDFTGKGTGGMAGGTFDGESNTMKWKSEDTIEGQFEVHFDDGRDVDAIGEKDVDEFIRSNIEDIAATMNRDSIEEIKIKSIQPGSKSIRAHVDITPTEEAGAEWLDITGSGEERETYYQAMPERPSGTSELQGHAGHVGPGGPHKGHEGKDGEGASTGVGRAVPDDYTATEHGGARILMKKDMDSSAQSLSESDVKDLIDGVPEEYRGLIGDVRVTDTYWQDEDGTYNFNIAATYYLDDGAIEIHANDMLPVDDLKEYYQGTMRHETAHALEERLGSDFQKDWAKAVKREPEHISEYGARDAHEDFAETMKNYWSHNSFDRRMVERFFPERKKVLDKYGIKPGVDR